MSSKKTGKAATPNPSRKKDQESGQNQENNDSKVGQPPVLATVSKKKAGRTATKRKIYVINSDDDNDEDYQPSPAQRSRASTTANETSRRHRARAPSRRKSVCDVPREACNGNDLDSGNSDEEDVSVPATVKKKTATIEPANGAKGVDSRLTSNKEMDSTHQPALSAEAVSNAATPEWLQVELDRLRMEAEADFNKRQDVIAANLIGLSDQEFQELEKKTSEMQRHPNALKVSKTGLVSKFDELVKKTFIDCGFDELVQNGRDEMGVDDVESDDDASTTGGHEMDMTNNSESFDPAETGSSLLSGATRIMFQGTAMKLARNAEEFQEFVTAIRARILSYAEDEERRRFIESYNESTIYRGLMTMHTWLVFCATKTENPDQLTPEILRSFRDWLLTLKTNVKRRFADKTRFSSTMQKETIGAHLVRVFMIYKMMGVIPLATRLGHFLGGKEEACVFYSWMNMQAGLTRPYSRFPILPSDVDYFLEQLLFATDKEFEAALYMLTMVNVGARTASLLHVNYSCHGGLLAKDITFFLLPNHRLSCRIRLTHEKQAQAVNSVREVNVQDRDVSISLPMAMFVQFVRLDLFEYEPADILDPGKFGGPGDNRFRLRNGVESDPVFRRWKQQDESTYLSKIFAGHYMPNALTMDAQFFDLYSKVMRLPKRGFSARSLRQGLAIRVILQDIKERGYFDKTSCLNRLTGTGIWNTKVALRYIEDFMRTAYNPTVQVYGSSRINTDLSDDDLYISPSRYRLTEEEYIEADDRNVLKLVDSIPDVQQKRDFFAAVHKNLADALAVAGVEVPESLVISKTMKAKLTAANVNVETVTALKDVVVKARKRLNVLIRERAAQFADDINYRTLTRRMNELGVVARQELKVFGFGFDFVAMAKSVAIFNRREALWRFSPASKPELVQPGMVTCVMEGCNVKATTGTEMAQHLSQKHQVNLVPTRKENTVERFAKRGTRSSAGNSENGRQRSGIRRGNMVSEGDSSEDLERSEDENEDGASVVSSEQSCRRFLCKDPNCHTAFGQMSYLTKHFRAKHWVFYECKTCEKEYVEPKFKPEKHVGHDFIQMTNNFVYGDYRLPACPKCQAYLASCGIPNVRCVLSMENVQLPLRPEHVDELFAAFRLGSVGDLDGAAMQKSKREILYAILKRRLHGHVDNAALPSCVLKEVQRLYSEDGFVFQSQEI